MRAAEFEEKEYEGPLCAQLGHGPLFWPPGQVLENYLGFDRGLFVTARYLWSVHGVRSPLRGVIPYDEYWPFLPHFARRRDRLPSFRLNCFIQVKRCHVGRRLPKVLAALGTNRPFFRIDIDDAQQATLDRAAAALAGRALFIYAAPVFGTARELFSLMMQGRLVENSTFPGVGALSGHRAWYYSEPGAVGLANPDYERIELPSLADRVRDLRRESGRTELGAAPSDQLASLSRAIRGAVQGAFETAEADPRAAYLAQDWQDIASYTERFEVPPAGRAFLEVMAFGHRYNLEWFTVAPG